MVGHTVILCLIFDEMPNCFHGDNVYAFQCLHTSSMPCLSLVLMTVILGACSGVSL